MIDFWVADSITPDTVVVDPCCGRGIFLTMLRKRFGSGLRIYGIEKDVGKAYLAAAFFQPNSNSRYVGNIFCRDSLTIRNYEKEILKVAKRSGAVALMDTVGSDTQEPSRIVFVGNPPYHKEGGAGGTAGSNIYHHFVEHALANGNEALFVIPARWYSAGRGTGLNEFRTRMLTNQNVKTIVDFPLSQSVFANAADIESGICFLHVANDYHGECSFVAGSGEAHQLVLSKFDIVIREPQAASIVEKVLTLHSDYMKDYVAGDTAFGLATNFPRSTKIDGPTLICRGREGLVPINADQVTRRRDFIPLWKVIASEAFGLGDRPDKQGRRRVMGVLEVLPPDHVCSQTYIVLSAFKAANEAENCHAYFRLKFPRFLLGLRKITQHISSKTFSWVPKMDFTRSWTDHELCDHFNLTTDERAYIEATIR